MSQIPGEMSKENQKAMSGLYQSRSFCTEKDCVDRRLASKKTQDTGPSLITSCRSPDRQAVSSKAHSSLIRNSVVFKDGVEALDVGVAYVLKVRGTAGQVPGTILHILQGGSN